MERMLSHIEDYVKASLKISSALKPCSPFSRAFIQSIVSREKRYARFFCPHYRHAPACGLTLALYSVIFPIATEP
jgi:hypothetical protein